MNQPFTASQTVGPFSHEAWRWASELTANVNSTAPTIVVSGIIYDGDGTPVNDAQIEAWLPDAGQSESTHAIPGFRRVASDEAGGFRFELSLSSGPLAGRPAAFITVFARGLGKHQFSAVFLADDGGLADSAILRQVPAERRATLIASKTADAQYRWDIHLQGPEETVFFDYT